MSTYTDWLDLLPCCVHCEQFEMEQLEIECNRYNRKINGAHCLIRQIYIDLRRVFNRTCIFFLKKRQKIMNSLQELFLFCIFFRKFHIFLFTYLKYCIPLLAPPLPKHQTRTKLGCPSFSLPPPPLLPAVPALGAL